MIQTLTELDAVTERQLRAYLAAAPVSSGVCAEHDPRWLRVLREALRHEPIVLIARDDRSGDICGYLPLALVSTRLFGRFLVSLPYLNRAGIVADPAPAPGMANELLQAAVELAERRDVQYLELRHHELMVNHELVTHRRDDKVRMVLDLPRDASELWNTIGSKVRNQVRKGEKSGLVIRWDGEALLEDFYSVFAVNMRDLGTPVYPRKLFACILEQFPGEAELAVVYCEDIPVAGALLLHEFSGGGAGGGRCTQVPSASSLRQFNATNANMWMYHRLLCRAIERGSGAFDFGRSSPDSGTHHFKKQWGAQPHPTVWQYHLRRGELDGMRPDHPRHQRRIAAWRRLPVWVTRVVGPTIVRGIP